MTIIENSQIKWAPIFKVYSNNQPFVQITISLLLLLLFPLQLGNILMSGWACYSY